MVSRLGAGPSSTGDSVGNDHTPRWICSTTRESQGRFNATIERSNGTGRPGGRRHAETADRPPGDGGREEEQDGRADVARRRRGETWAYACRGLGAASGPGMPAPRYHGSRCSGNSWPPSVLNFGIRMSAGCKTRWVLYLSACLLPLQSTSGMLCQNATQRVVGYGVRLRHPVAKIIAANSAHSCHRLSWPELSSPDGGPAA